MDMPRRLRVELAERSYDILVGAGLIGRAGEFLAPLVPKKRVFIVTEERVAPLYLERLESGLTRAGIACGTAVLAAGEATKDFAHLDDLVDRMLAAKVERSTTLIALGGGVIGDLAGFAAAIALRGIPFVQMPTTLLSQVDSSVGGKTGINTKRGKNLVGAFYQPRLVLADTGALATLPPREMRAGYAEVVKYGLIDDHDFFAWLEKNGADVLAQKAEALERAVVTSCAAKARVVAADERESGLRALLNLGHTFGHAFEAECGYGDELLHGEAVAFGMVMAFDISVRLGLCPAEDAARVRRHFASVGLPVKPADVTRRRFDPDRLIAHMGQDKKVTGGEIGFVLARGIGKSFIDARVPLAELRSFLAEAAGA